MHGVLQHTLETDSRCSQAPTRQPLNISLTILWYHFKNSIVASGSTTSILAPLSATALPPPSPFHSFSCCWRITVWLHDQWPFAVHNSIHERNQSVKSATNMGHPPILWKSRALSKSINWNSISQRFDDCKGRTQTFICIIVLHLLHLHLHYSTCIILTRH